MYSNMLLASTVLLAGLVAGHGPHNDSHTSGEMGPAAFMWPEDRPWSADADNTPPCGSSSGVGERHEFPMTNGRLALVAQEDTRAVHVGVSYSNDPQSIRDFEIFHGPQQVGDLGLGHTCITAPNPPENLTAGTNATFMFFYLNEDDDSSDDETFYACTDITYVETTVFTERIPCFNATTEEPEVQTDSAVSVTTTAPDGSDPHSESDGDDGLSGGAIAGAVVGSVLGALAIAGLAFFFLHRGKRAQPPMAQTKDVERAESDTSSR